VRINECPEHRLAHKTLSINESLFFPSRKVIFLPSGDPGLQTLAVNLDCALFADVVIPENPEAYVKLTESAIRNSSGRHQSQSRPPLLTCNQPSPLRAPLPALSQLCATSMLRQKLLL